MDAILSGTDALALTRAARRDPELALLPVSNAVCQEWHGPADLLALREALPKELARFDAEHPVALTCFSRATRSQSSLVRAQALLAPLPEGSFLQVARADGAPLGVTRDGDEVRLYVESPGLCLVRASQWLSARVASEALSAEAAFARLAALPMEACGLYARDPLSPAAGECAYDLAPLADEDDLRRYLSELRSVKGVRLAREAARYAKNGSGSPGETLLSLVMRLPPRRGGVPFPHFEENEPIAWPDEARQIIKHQTMRPDFNWPEHLTALEYYGDVHGTGKAFVEDHFRMQDYGACGIELVPATYEDIRTIDALDRCLTLVARKLARFEDPGFFDRVLRNIKDERSRAERRILLAQLLPPVPRTDA